MGKTVISSGAPAPIDRPTPVPFPAPKGSPDPQSSPSAAAKAEMPVRDLNFTEPAVIYGGNVNGMQFASGDLKPKTTMVTVTFQAATGMTASKPVTIQIPWPSPPPKTPAAEREALDTALAAAVEQMSTLYGIGSDRGATGNMLSSVTPSSAGYQGCAAAANTANNLVSRMDSEGLLKFHQPDMEREQPYNMVWAHKGFSIREKDSGTLYAVDFWKDPKEYGTGDKSRVSRLDVWAPKRGTVVLAHYEAEHIPTVLEQSLSKSFAKLAPKADSQQWQGFRQRFSQAGGNLENIVLDNNLRKYLNRPNMTEAEWTGIKQGIRDDARRVSGVPSSWQAAIQTIVPIKTNPN